jgi:hypothetical protein
MTKINLDSLTTKEMTDAQYKTWTHTWIKEYAASMVAECGMTKKDAKFHAEHAFENFIGQAGDEARDERIMHARSYEGDAAFEARQEMTAAEEDEAQAQHAIDEDAALQAQREAAYPATAEDVMPRQRADRYIEDDYDPEQVPDGGWDEIPW